MFLVLGGVEHDGDGDISLGEPCSPEHSHGPERGTFPAFHEIVFGSHMLAEVGWRVHLVLPCGRGMGHGRDW